MADDRIWTKNFIMTMLAGLFSAMVFYTTLATFAVYAVFRFEAGESVAGFAASIFLLGSVFGRTFSGRYLELVGRRRMVIVGGILFIVLCAAYLLPVGLAVFLVIRFLHGITFGAIQNALQTIVIKFIPPKRLGEGLGYFSLNFILAAGAGPFIGLHILKVFTYPELLYLCVFLSVVAFILSFFIDIKEPEFTEEQRLAFKKPFSIKDVFEKAALPLACMAILVGACYTSITAFLEAYTIELHLTAYTPYYFLILTVVVIIVRPRAGRLLDRKGENIVMYPSLLCFVLSLAILVVTGSGVILFLSAVMLALGFGNVLIMGQTIAAKSVPPHRTAKANATYFAFSDMGYGIGPLLFGMVSAFKGFSVMYAVGALVMVGAMVLYHCVHGKNHFRKSG